VTFVLHDSVEGHRVVTSNETVPLAELGFLVFDQLDINELSELFKVVHDCV